MRSSRSLHSACAKSSRGVEVRVNFGVFAGRRATPAEIDELAKALLPKVGEVAIVAEERHEIGGRARRH